MTDNEIIKALKYCSNKDNTCENCMLYDAGDDECECVNELKHNALALINRQKAEVERLMKERDLLGVSRTTIVDMMAACDKGFQEGVKEFAERLKKHSYFDDKDQRRVIAEVIIDYSLKEMVGDSE